jgi:hypothetical protein
MYQQSLLSSSVSSQLKYLNNGVNGKVWDCGNGTVVKISRRDDITRNWLEFCMWHREHGGDMALIPEVHSLVDCYTQDERREWVEADGEYKTVLKDVRGYIVVMKKYNDQPRQGDWGRKLWGHGCVNQPEEHPAFKTVLKAFQDYMMRTVGNYYDSYDLFGDLHGGNIMMDGKKPVILDPSNGEYQHAEVVHPSCFQLEMQ